MGNGCGCLKKTDSEYAKLKEMAVRLSRMEKTDYVIYHEKQKKYFDRKSCWAKAGKPGVPIEFIYFV